MNRDKDLIKQIRILKDIKPDSDWANLVKSQIVGHEMVGQKQPFTVLMTNFLFKYRMAVVGVLLFAITGGGIIITSQNSLPGQPLYAVKKATEKGLALFAGKNDPVADLQLAAKRLEEINLISQKNLVKNLPAAFYEYKTAKAAAKKEVAARVKRNPEQAGQIIREAGLAMKDIDEKEKQVYGVLGLDQSTSSAEASDEITSDKTIIEALINYFKNGAILSEEQANDLTQVKDLYEKGDYEQAIDYYLNSSLNK